MARRCCGTSCCTAVSQLLILPGDSPAEIRFKRLMTPVCIGVIPVVALLVRGPPVVAPSSGYFGLLALILFFSLGRTRLVPTMRLADAVLLLFSVASLIADANNAATLNPRMWSLIVLILDMALVFERDWLQPVMICGTLSYLLFDRLEAMYRFGFYDLQQPWEGQIPLCDCVAPPCAQTLEGNVSFYCGFALTLLVDFHLTRGFAKGLKGEMLK
eukprot:Hpha_TRINITY_DN15361_c6_g1::TRINITY_DN15361_c6_g1_i1::g.88030::m.88030